MKRILFIIIVASLIMGTACGITTEPVTDIEAVEMAACNDCLDIAASDYLTPLDTEIKGIIIDNIYIPEMSTGSNGNSSEIINDFYQSEVANTVTCIHYDEVVLNARVYQTRAVIVT